MKHILTIGIILAISANIIAQKVVVTETEEVVDKVSRKGLSIILLLDLEKVQETWKKQLKEWGKTETKKEAIYVEDAHITSLSGSPLRLISRIQPSPKGVKIWYTIDLGDSYITSSSPKYQEAERILHDFGVKMYLDDVNEQIKDAERALVKSVRDQERMLQKGVSIKNGIIRNRQENVRLIQKLADNKMELDALKSDSVQNSLNQKLANDEVEKIKKAVEVVRGKLLKVE